MKFIRGSRSEKEGELEAASVGSVRGWQKRNVGTNGNICLRERERFVVGVRKKDASGYDAATAVSGRHLVFSKVGVINT